EAAAAARAAFAAGRTVDEAWPDLPYPEETARDALTRAYRQLRGDPPYEPPHQWLAALNQLRPAPTRPLRIFGPVPSSSVRCSTGASATGQARKHSCIQQPPTNPKPLRFTYWTCPSASCPRYARRVLRRSREYRIRP